VEKGPLGVAAASADPLGGDFDSSMLGALPRIRRLIKSSVARWRRSPTASIWSGTSISSSPPSRIPVRAALAIQFWRPSGHQPNHLRGDLPHGHPSATNRSHLGPLCRRRLRSTLELAHTRPPNNAQNPPERSLAGDFFGSPARAADAAAAGSAISFSLRAEPQPDKLEQTAQRPVHKREDHAPRTTRHRR
jgi:hypothetical protein